MTFRYGDNVSIKKDEKHGGFYEGVRCQIVAIMEEEAHIIIGEKRKNTYSVILPKIADDKSARYLEVKEDEIQAI